MLLYAQSGAEQEGGSGSAVHHTDTTLISNKSVQGGHTDETGSSPGLLLMLQLHGWFVKSYRQTGKPN